MRNDGGRNIDGYDCGEWLAKAYDYAGYSESREIAAKIADYCEKSGQNVKGYDAEYWHSQA